MVRLNSRAYAILKAEIERCTTPDAAGQVQREIALRRLDKLRDRTGTPATREELHDLVSDLFPDFRDNVLAHAARVNQPPSPLWTGLKWGTIAAVTLVGGVWVLNLPYPMIRWPVARTMPLVLLPSFIGMDHNYRQAIARTEQADQLVNQATSPADFELGRTKVKQAQTHLDALPVWFLGYYPQMYCSWFQCGWRFTLDEFQQARKDVARMEARLFQEDNAIAQLNQADQAVGTAKQQYQEAPNPGEKTAAIAQWQQAVDQMQQIPPETLAGRMARTKLQSYERDLAQVGGLASGLARSSNLIAAAQSFAQQASTFSLAQPHPSEEWEEAQRLWREAVDYLERVTEQDPAYAEAMRLKAQYERSLSQVRIRLQAEQRSLTLYEEAQTLANQLWQRQAGLSANEATAQLRQIVLKTKQVRPGTTVYADAQALQKEAEVRLK